MRVFFLTGMYLMHPEINTIKKVMFEPLTTSICDIPESRNFSCRSSDISSTRHIDIPKTTHATSRGNH